MKIVPKLPCSVFAKVTFAVCHFSVLQSFKEVRHFHTKIKFQNFKSQNFINFTEKAYLFALYNFLLVQRYQENVTCDILVLILNYINKKNSACSWQISINVWFFFSTMYICCTIQKIQNITDNQVFMHLTCMHAVSYQDSVISPKILMVERWFLDQSFSISCKLNNCF